MTPIEQVTVGVYLLGAFIGVLGIASIWFVARPFTPWTRDKERPDVPAE